MVYFFNHKMIILSLIVYLFLIYMLAKRKKRGVWFFVFFTIMYVYIVLVIKITQFPIYNDPEMMEAWGGIQLGRDINLIPLKDAFNRSGLLNIIMTIPFGFLMPFLHRCNYKKSIEYGFALGVSIETLQLIVGVIIGYTTRIVDVNDVIFNTCGTFLGYLIFLLFVNLTKILFKGDTDYNSLVNYILEIAGKEKRR